MFNYKNRTDSKENPFLKSSPGSGLFNISGIIARYFIRDGMRNNISLLNSRYISRCHY